MGFETIGWDARDRVATVTLNRPDVLNALNDLMAEELLAALDRAASTPAIRAVVLTGAGRGFLAGQDLNSVGDMRATEKFSEHLARTWNPIVQGLWSLEKPVVAAVNGVTVGAGLGLVLASDLVVASEAAKFITAFATLGFVPDGGLTWLLPRRVGLARAMEIALLAEPVGAAQALNLGLVNTVVPHDALLDTARGWAARLAAGPTLALGMTKRLIHDGLRYSLAEALTCEGEVQDVVGESDDSREGVAAFLERRPPRFTGH